LTIGANLCERASSSKPDHHSPSLICISEVRRRSFSRDPNHHPDCPSDAFATAASPTGSRASQWQGAASPHASAWPCLAPVPVKAPELLTKSQMRQLDNQDHHSSPCRRGSWIIQANPTSIITLPVPSSAYLASAWQKHQFKCAAQKYFKVCCLFSIRCRSTTADEVVASKLAAAACLSQNRRFSRGEAGGSTSAHSSSVRSLG
jgi:hypothetical protein